MTETLIYATSASAGVQLRYVQETVGANTVFTDIGKITDMSSPGTVWTIQSRADGGRGLVNVSGDTIFVTSGGVLPFSLVSSPFALGVTVSGGVQVSGTVNISGPVAIQSGGTLPISLVSSPFALGVTVSGGVQVSGAVNVSGFVGTLSGGTLPVSVVSNGFAPQINLMSGLQTVGLSATQIVDAGLLIYDLSAAAYRQAVVINSGIQALRVGALAADFNATVTGGLQVSGAVNVSGFVGTLSGGTIPVSIVSANPTFTVTGGVQVSGAVNVSGFVGALSGGTLPVVLINTSSVANFSGLFLASGLYLASGIWLASGIFTQSGIYLASGIINQAYITQNPPTALSGTTPINVVVAASSAIVLSTNLSRKGAVFVETSANIISFGLGTSANVGFGITLTAAGGAWTMDQFTYTTQAIYAISNVSGSGLGIQELV